MTKTAQEPKNPLASYQEATKTSISDISRLTGLPKQTISDLIHISPLRMGAVRLRTVHALKKHLHLDLLKYFEELDKLRT